MITSNLSSATKANMESARSNRRHRSNHEETEFSNQSIMNAMEKFVRTVQEMDETILVPCRLMDLKIGDASDTTPVGETTTEMQALIKHADLYSLYTMVNSVKNELLWGLNNAHAGEPSGPLFVPGVVVGSNCLPPTGTTSQTPPPSNATANSSSLPITKTHSRNSSASNIKPEKGIGGGGGGVVVGGGGGGGGVGSHQRRPSTGSLISTHSMTSVSLSDTDSEAGNENDSGIEDGTAVDPTQKIAHTFRRHLMGLHKSLEQMTRAAGYLTQRYQHDVGGNV